MRSTQSAGRDDKFASDDSDLQSEQERCERDDRIPGTHVGFWLRSESVSFLELSNVEVISNVRGGISLLKTMLLHIISSTRSFMTVAACCDLSSIISGNAGGQCQSDTRTRTARAIRYVDVVKFFQRLPRTHNLNTCRRFPDELLRTRPMLQPNKHTASYLTK